MAETTPLVPIRALRRDEIVTQYDAVTRAGGEVGAFRKCPRPSDHDGLSAMVGRYTAEEASLLVRGRPSGTPEDDRVRYSTVARLHDQGFVVTHKPSRKNPNHILVTHSRHGVVWPKDLEETFRMCFDVTVEGGG